MKVQRIDMRVIQPKRPRQTDSCFYDGEIATATKPNGTVLSLIATGDIQISIGNDDYRNSTMADAVAKYGLTDAKLRRLERTGQLTWHLNNWFEVMWLPHGTDTWESALGEVAYDYDAALSLLRSYYDDNAY